MINKNLNNFIENALLEDVGSGDHSSIASIDLHKENKAKLIIKDDGIIAGISLINATLWATFAWFKKTLASLTCFGQWVHL